jgi:CHAT domain-containing protein
LTRAVQSTGLDGERGSLARLPYTRAEAKAILALAPQTQSFGAFDFAANQAAAIDPALGQYRYVHFATHGLLNDTHPELSGLVLSLLDREGRAQDGFLRMVEVFNLNLPAELVVLSGCKTGLGKEIRGEGLIGLTRGFMHAGAARVLVSLWDVNDRATAELMTRVYRGMLGKGLRPAAALRAAQLELSKQPQWRAPYYWASFVLMGEPQ